MCLFYCLYFCIFFKNPEIVEFLRFLINKMEANLKISKELLAQIDENGIDRLRTVGEVINSQLYHMVFYYAVQDDLRVVYAQIMKQLKAIQLRDEDALKFLVKRDYELIRLSFDKFTTKINFKNFKGINGRLKSHGYRKYN